MLPFTSEKVNLRIHIPIQEAAPADEAYKESGFSVQSSQEHMFLTAEIFAPALFSSEAHIENIRTGTKRSTENKRNNLRRKIPVPENQEQS